MFLRRPTKKSTGDFSKEVDGKEIDGKEIDGKEIDGKEIDGKEIDGKEVDGKEMDGKEMDAQKVDAKKIDALRSLLDRAEAVVIGGGAGLSTSAGFTYAGERFEKHFSDFAEKYGFQDMYTGGFTPFSSQEEFWAYWSRHISINRYEDPPKPVYQDLLELVREKDYFVLTTNVDHCFQKAGFDKARLFYTQGDYGLFQCSRPCCQMTWDNEDAVREMLARQADMRIPSDLLPVCPNCGEPLTMNLRSDDTFVQDQGWYQAAERYNRFLRERDGKAILFWELGVGYNTPAIIKYPFWQMTLKNPKAHYVCVNYGQAAAPKEIAKRSVCIDGDIGTVLSRLRDSARS